MKLAAGVGRTADVDGMLDSIDEETFRKWQAFDAFTCPIGPDRWDGPVAAFMAVVVRYLGGLAGEKPEVLQEITPQTFCSWLDDPPEAEPDELMEAEAMRANMESAVLLARART
ncbi:phage tail assembly protein T [Planctomicrobium sp. SH661]|uniref:phage tail assembly protein T n=1 Tax=Planctomicrobium sp. SH661 TaxID=3448124 RepID=UPI003F5C9895